MRFGLCFGDFEHAAEKLPLAKKRLGYDYVEVALCKLADWNDAQLKEFGAACEAAGLKTEATNIFFSGSAPLTGPNVDVKSLLDYTDKALYKAASLGVKTSVLGSGAARKVPDGFSKEDAFQQMAELTYQLGDVAKKYGVTIVIEPLNHTETNLINSGKEGLALMRQVNHPSVGILLDYYHMCVDHEDVSIVAQAAESGKLKHTHISAPSRYFPRGEELEACMPFFAALKAVGYDGRMSSECIGDPLESDWDSKIIREALARA